MFCFVEGYRWRENTHITAVMFFLFIGVVYIVTIRSPTSISIHGFSQRSNTTSNNVKYLANSIPTQINDNGCLGLLYSCRRPPTWSKTGCKISPSNQNPRWNFGADCLLREKRIPVRYKNNEAIWRQGDAVLLDWRDESTIWAYTLSLERVQSSWRKVGWLPRIVLLVPVVILYRRFLLVVDTTIKNTLVPW